MKKQLIGTLVGALILFIWQFLSWTLLPVHQSEYGYTPNHERIMAVLNENLTQEGTYMLPGMAPGLSSEQTQAAMEASTGKPWAHISYHRSMDTNMGLNMIRGFATDLVAAFLLIWLLVRLNNLTISTAVQASVIIGLIGYLTIPYLNSIWFEKDSIGHLIDAVAPWSIVGVWLGWWLTRK